MQSLKKIHAWAQMKVPLCNIDGRICTNLTRTTAPFQKTRQLRTYATKYFPH